MTAERRVIVDSNLLLLLAVGLASPGFIPLHRGLRAYSVDDFDLLSRLLSPPAHIVLTPNTLTEVSNLVDRAGQAARIAAINGALRRLVERYGEEYLPSLEGFATPEIDPLGLTDSVLLRLAATGPGLLTADVPLYLTAMRLGVDATNFNHHREAYWYRR